MNRKSPVRSFVQNQFGILVFDRPERLNSLDIDMVEHILAAVIPWIVDDSVKVLVLTSSHSRSFCAGGDIRALAYPTWPEYSVNFFRREFSLVHLLSVYPKPVISFMQGSVMGGGCGMCMHGDFRVCYSPMSWAMPETAIGILPDVGATLFLPRIQLQLPILCASGLLPPTPELGCSCPSLSLFLALTGRRLNLHEAALCGIATHIAPLESSPQNFVGDSLLNSLDVDLRGPRVSRCKALAHALNKACDTKLEFNGPSSPSLPLSLPSFLSLSLIHSLVRRENVSITV